MSLIFRYPRYNNLFRDMELLEHALFSPFKEEESQEQAMETVNDEKKFGVNLNVSQFKPEELQVNLDGRVLTVEGKHESNDDNCSIQRSFIRKWLLPEDTDLASLRSQLDDKGQLSIEAPKVVRSAGRPIAIERTSSTSDNIHQSD